jgi:very-short-patch-repair endonuclease
MNDPSRRAQALRQRQTAAEARLWRVLRNGQLNGWKFRRQHPVGEAIADFACIAAKLVVEVDGATHATEAERLRDERRTEALMRCGFAVLRVHNVDVAENLEGVRETILAAIERRTSL